ncbi:MAG: DNA polymerase Y family protein [Rhodocyclales bacterium]|nr:DNA polymerase Y family protein [Rhodocyclales bacterium]
MLWLAVHCPPPASAGTDVASPPSAAHAADFWPTLACWAGRYTPRVNLVADALRIEIGGSLRLFGGLESLLAQARADLATMGVAAQLAVAATPLAALWLARAGDGTVCADLAATRERLAGVPVSALQLPPPLARRVAGFGLRRVGELLALPRASLGARLGRPLLLDLARALGELPDPQTDFVFPECFEQGLELPAPVDAAPVLLFAARRLVAALAGWLEARNGALRQALWHIDHGHGAVTELPLAFSAPVHQALRIEGVLKQRLEALHLRAPALGLRLCATDVELRPGASQVLFEGAGQGQGALADLLDRLVARLGPEAVQGRACHADHRPERSSRATAAKAAAASSAQDIPPRPLWLLDAPEVLREVRGRPQHGGPLALAAGPERIESGWWDGADMRRDYFIAIDGAGRWLWIFHESGKPGGWYLHGLFA